MIHYSVQSVFYINQFQYTPVPLHVPLDWSIKSPRVLKNVKDQCYKLYMYSELVYLSHKSNGNSF